MKKILFIALIFTFSNVAIDFATFDQAKRPLFISKLDHVGTST